MRESRRRAVDLLRIHGSLTIDELAQHLHATRNAAVNHLAALEREGLVTRAGLRKGKRRPSVAYALTELANGLFPQGYDAFAILLLDEVKRARGSLAAAALRRISKRWIARDLPMVKSTHGDERLKRVAAILAAQGFMPKIRAANGKYVLEQYNCPVKRVGAEHPEVCEVVTRWIQALVDAPLTQTQCASRGAAFCAYVPRSVRKE